MKPAVKIALVLGVVVVAGSICMWRWGPSWRPPKLPAATTQGSHANVPSRDHPLAPVAANLTPESVRPIVAAAADFPFVERVKAVRELSAELAAQEIQSFYAYLLAPATSGAENRQQENWLRNEMMDKLAEAPTLPAGFVRVLVAIYQDPAQDIVMRDYAVQHMMPVYARASAEEKATLQQILWQAVEETDSSIAGTALLELRELAQDHPEFELSKLGAVVLKLAGDDHCGELSRITALQLCGGMGINQAAPLILQLAQNAGSVPLQIAAIAALGDVGNKEARIYLRQLASQPESRLRPALETALKKMDGRLGI